MKAFSQYEALLGIVARTPGAVAFSGGADSSLLLRAAVDVYGGQALAFFADSVLQTAADRANGVRTADQIGATLQVIEISPLRWREFTVNRGDRCYHCKKNVYQLFKDLLPKKGMVLFDGSNLDDLRQDRPGRRAIVELGVVTPLIEAGLGKAAIRSLGQYLDVPTWDRDSASCLATRIPTSMEITENSLRLVADYEKILLAAGFAGCRAKLCAADGQSINIEVKENDFSLLSQPETRQRLRSKFKKLGVANLFLSLTGR
jgi:uncharacterized protein